MDGVRLTRATILLSAEKGSARPATHLPTGVLLVVASSGGKRLACAVGDGLPSLDPNGTKHNAGTSLHARTPSRPHSAYSLAPKRHRRLAAAVAVGLAELLLPRPALCGRLLDLAIGEHRLVSHPLVIERPAGAAAAAAGLEGACLVGAPGAKYHDPAIS